MKLTAISQMQQSAHVQPTTVSTKENTAVANTTPKEKVVTTQTTEQTENTKASFFQDKKKRKIAYIAGATILAGLGVLVFHNKFGSKTNNIVNNANRAEELLEGVGAKAEELVESAKTVTEKVAPKAQEAIEETAVAAKEVVAETQKTVNETIKVVEETIEKAATEAPKAVEEAAQKVATEAPKAVEEAAEKVATEAPKAVEEAAQKVATEAPKAVEESAEKVAETAEKASTEAPVEKVLTEKEKAQETVKAAAEKAKAELEKEIAEGKVEAVKGEDYLYRFVKEVYVTPGEKKIMELSKQNKAETLRIIGPENGDKYPLETAMNNIYKASDDFSKDTNRQNRFHQASDLIEAFLVKYLLKGTYKKTALERAECELANTSYAQHGLGNILKNIKERQLLLSHYAQMPENEAIDRINALCKTRLSHQAFFVPAEGEMTTAQFKEGLINALNEFKAAQKA